MSYKFYEETRFKDSEVGPIPKDWQVVRLGEVAVIRQGKQLSSKESIDGKIKMPFLRTSNILWNRIDLKNISFMYFTKEEIEKLKLKKGDVLICEGGDVGRTAVWEGQIENCSYQNHIHRVRVRSDILFNYFLSYFMEYGVIYKRLLVSSANRTTIPNLSSSRLKQTPIPLPPLSEQKAIAEVLSTIQEAKEKTEEVIKATRELKKSLMKHLFTYGPVPLSETDMVKLKETEIGLIPEHWQVVRLGEVAEILMGQSPPGSSYNQSGKGLPFLQGKAEFGDIYPKAVKYTTMPIKRAKINSVLLSVRAPVGDVNIADKEYCIGRGLSSICFKESLGKNYFLFYYFIYRKKTIEELGTGSTFKAINKSQIENLPIPLPLFTNKKPLRRFCRR